MTPWPLPEINSLIELTLAGERTYQTRVDAIDGVQLVVPAPPDLVVGDVPADGAEMTICWCGVRGRHVAEARIVQTLLGLVSVWTLEITARPRVEQRRQHVRGGGGEPIEICPRPAQEPEDTISLRADRTPDAAPLRGRVIDLSEGSARARFESAPLAVGDGVTIQLWLDTEDLEIAGTVARLAVEPGQRGVDVVVRYELDEARAARVRRHVLTSQMRARAAAPTSRR